MKYLSSRPRDFLASCIFVLAANFLLFQIMARTHLMEKVMGLTFHWWELLVIVLFLAFRLAAYLIVPPVLVALAAYAVVKKIQPPTKS